VVLLQHPREHRTPIGTARMAHLGLPGSELRVGVELDGDPVVERLFETPDTYVLFPGPRALPIEALPADRPATLVVIDGTWSQARKLLTRNPRLAALPRVGFSPRRQSEYRIRQQPAPHCVSTIEALAEVLERLEGVPFEGLLAPFRAMVDTQVRFKLEVKAGRHQHSLLRARKARRPRPPTLAERLRALGPRLVFAQGEANAWPARHPDRRPAELVHWVAERAATGERFEAVLAPRGPLAPSTPSHVRLAPAALLGGEPLAAARARWAAFLRPDDVLVTWGHFYATLAREAGFDAPEGLDLRAALAHDRRGRLGTLEAAGPALGLTAVAPALAGRAGQRLATLAAVCAAVAGPTGPA
jgi:DTW domain-containing protein YfiP